MSTKVSDTLDYTNIRLADVFRSYFYKILPDFKTRTEAYEFLESKHEEQHGFRKYTGYESFRQSYNSYIRKIRNGKQGQDTLRKFA